MAEAAAGKKPVEVKKSGDKKPNIFVRLWRKIKEVLSELKKVTWPTAGKTVKQTGVVLAVVLFFLVVILGFDTLLLWAFNFLTERSADASALFSALPL